MPARSFRRWLAAILLTYAVGFCAFYPDVLTASDEALYVEQAAAFADGTMTALSYASPGTSLLQTPFVWAGGWRAAAWASVLCMAATVVMLARWLRVAGYAPGFALLFLAYAPTLVVGRLALSDVPSAAVVTLGLWLFWTGEGSRWRWFLAGLAAGLSLLLRETNALIFLPFVLAAALRRERHWEMLVAGVLAGILVRLGVFHLLFGSALFMRDRESWSLAAAADSVLIYAVALLVLVPGGLLAVATYRGPRRAELITAVALYLAAYVFYDYSAQSTAGIARLAAAGRYVIPLVPLIAIAWAAAVSRLRADRLAGLAPVACTAILIAAFTVHPVMSAWSAHDAMVVRDLYGHTAVGSAVIADDDNRKYISPVYGRRARMWMVETPARELAAVTTQHASTYVALVSRSETALMAALSTDAERYVQEARHACRLDLVHDRAYGSARRLRIWSVRSCTA